MRRILFILNPTAGSKKLVIDASVIASFFSNSDVQVDTEYSKYPGHAKEMVLAYKSRGVTDIIAVGGDGSFSDVASYLIDSNIACGIIPTGSGNGIARHIGIPCHSIKALDIIKEGLYQYVDVGKMNEKYFFSNSGLGIDSDIIEQYDQTNGRGWFTYGRLGVQEYFRYKPKSIRADWGEGEKTFEPAIFSIAISNQFGYNFKIAPDASMINGLFDVQIMPMLPPHRAIGFAWAMMRGKYYKHKSSIRVMTKSIRVHLDSPGIIQCDGESVRVDNKIEYKVIPRALKMIVPRKAIENI